VRRRLVVYVPALVGGGAERVAALLASAFAAAGHGVTLVADFDAPQNRAFVGPDVAYAVLGGGHGRSTARLAQLLRKLEPDVALAIGGAADVKLVAAQGLARARTRVVLSYHGRSAVGGGLLGRSAYWTAGLLTRIAARTVCVSDDLARHLVGDWGAAADRVVRIHNPVAIGSAGAARTEAELRARPPVVIGMGRLSREKGFDTLITAMALLPRPDARLVVHGDGPERARLEALARRLGLADRVSLPGYATNPWPAFAQGRCFALASDSEAFGNVVVEALAAGLPVVATASGGPPEILDHGRYGAIVPVRDAAALAGALAAMLDDPGDPGPRIARAHDFRAEAAAAHYLALFEEMLAAGA
jgi:glycosyltransferase involved in cell wall biosynthesis